MTTIDFHRFFFAFLCSGNTPAPGASGDGFGGPGAYFSPIAGRRSGRYLRSKRGIRLQAQLRLAHVPTRSLAFLARFAPVPTRIFLGPYSPLAGAILEGPPAHNCYFKPRISATLRVGRPRRRRGLPIRPYLHARITRITVVEQLPQINTAIIITTNIAAAGAVDRELLYIGRARARARGRARARDFESRAGSGAAGDRKVNGF